MSLSGKLLRGLKWHKFRNVDGKYDKEIKDSPHKMEEIEFYLDFIKVRDAKKVHEVLEQVMLLDLNGRETQRAEEAKKLETLQSTKSKEKK